VPASEAVAADEPEGVSTERAEEDGAGIVTTTDVPVASNGNGTAAAAAPVAATVISAPPRSATPAPPAPTSEAEAERATRRLMNRREFLMYSWAAALGLLTVEMGVSSFVFLYPRFRAGEFGGQFFVPLSDVPPADQDPNGKYTSGKFWLVTTAEGKPKALYMVCVHLGCLYKWVASNHRFECPCHGSKYTHDGFYIEGPAARSLDSFEISVANGELIVDTGKKIVGAPASESPFRAVKV
jgi:cytochrome b6-f complex iron-sulfur subunit